MKDLSGAKSVLLRSIGVFAAAVAIGVSAIAHADSGEAKIRINVRDGAGADFPVVTTLSAGQKVDILEWDGEFVLVRTAGGSEGYLKSKYLTNVEKDMVAETAPMVPPVTAAPPAPVAEAPIAVPEVAAASDDAVTLNAVTVTGSRIKQTNLVTNSPVTQISREEISFQGTVRVEDMLRSLPQVYQNQGTGQSNGATGTATLNLRNLGDERTLVLVDGRRMPAGSPISGGIGVDINQIPAALIDRVEVLTGGASATYGSDAVAGVVNFIMKDDFQGLQFDAQVSGYNHDNDNSAIQAIVRDKGFEVANGTVNDGRTESYSVVIGGDLAESKGNVTAYITYRDIAGVDQSTRDYSSCALNGDATACAGSGTIPQGRITDFGIGDGFDFRVDGTEFVDRGDVLYNYGPNNYFQRPDEQWSAGAFMHYDLENATTYAKFMFNDNHTVSQIAESGAFFVTDTLQCGNPLLSEQQFQAVCGQFGLTRADEQTAFLGRRNVEGGKRQQDLRHTSFRTELGVKGDLSDVWSYDLTAQFAEVSMENTYLNDLSTTNITRALDAVTDPSTGEVVCRSTLDGSDSRCVPWNIFTTGGVTQDQLDYLVLPLFARGTTDQTVVSGYVAANLGDYGVMLPTAGRGIDVVLGAEKRDENLDFSPDNGFRTGDGAGQGGATGPVSGGYDVTEFFMEASIPLVEGAAFAEELTLDIGYRNSDYSTGINTDTYGIRAGWAINSSIKARASFQRAVRAANIQELFLPQGFNLFDMDADPCGGAVTNGQTAEGRTLEECARSGVTAAQFGTIPDSPAGQYNYLQGGNPNLDAEESDTYSIGVIWTPTMLSNLSLSLDYYNIEIEKGIASLSPEFILNECLDGNQSQCDKVNRGTAGDLWIGSDVDKSGNIVALQDNLAIEKVQGFDLVIDYSLDLNDLGAVKFNNVTGVITTWDQQELVGAPVVDCKGNWGATCGYPTPDLQNNLRVTWDTPWTVTASALWRHISEVKDLNGNDVDLGAVNYLDLAGTWSATENLMVRAGINNILDKSPPIGGANAGPANQGNGNIFPGMYDFLGRYVYLGVSLNL